jgi:O-antigen ligase
MAASIATLLYAALILGLFWLDRDRGSRASPALLIPVTWLALGGSRSVSEWLYVTRPGASAEALLEGDPVNRVVYTGLVAMGLAVLLFRGPKVLKLLQANAVIVVFLLYCALSLTWADHPDVGFKRWVKTVGDFVMVLIVVSERDPSDAIRRLFIWTGFLLIPLSMLMIKYYPDLARYYSRFEWATLYSGVTTNKNNLGAICMLFGLASASQFLAALSGRTKTGRGRRLVAHGLILVMVMWLFDLAKSTTSLMCFFTGIVLLIALEMRAPATQMGTSAAKEMRKSRLVAEHLLANALVAFLIVVPAMVLFGGLDGILRMLGKDPTLTDRTLIWELLFELAPNEWVGTGFENFWLGPRLDKIWSVYKWAPNQAHNGYVETFLNLGWIGVALVIAVLANGYRTVMTGFRRSPIGGLMLTFFVVGVVYNFTEAALFRMMAPAWVALLLAITRVPELHSPQTWQPPQRHTTERTARLRGPDKAQGHAVAISGRNA